MTEKIIKFSVQSFTLKTGNIIEGGGHSSLFFKKNTFKTIKVAYFLRLLLVLGKGNELLKKMRNCDAKLLLHYDYEIKINVISRVKIITFVGKFCQS